MIQHQSKLGAAKPAQKAKVAMTVRQESAAKTEGRGINRMREGKVPQTSEEVDAFLESYAGIDGGNPRGRVWVCGIEHGGGVDSPDTPLVPQAEAGSWTDAFKEDGRYRAWPYHHKVSKLMVAIRQLDEAADLEPTLTGWREYLGSELYSAHGETFKLNLFPLAATSVSNGEWEVNYRSRPGLADKQAYYRRCREKRFPFLAKLRGQYGAKVIIGTGITFRADFATAFGFEPESLEEFKIDGGGRDRSCFRATNGDDTLIVSPFFGGPYGASSDRLIVALARHVRASLQRA